MHNFCNGPYICIELLSGVFLRDIQYVKTISMAWCKTAVTSWLTRSYCSLAPIHRYEIWTFLHLYRANDEEVYPTSHLRDRLFIFIILDYFSNSVLIFSVRGGLADRLHRLISREKSAVAFWQHKLGHGQVNSGKKIQDLAVCELNSLAPEHCGNNSKSITFKLVIHYGSLGARCETALRWMP